MAEPIPSESPLQSKRFIAFMTSEMTWSVIVVLLLVLYRDSVSFHLWAALLALSIAKGSIEALYLGGQASLDSYVRLAQIAADAGMGIEHKGMKLTAGATPEAEAEPPEAPKP